MLHGLLTELICPTSYCTKVIDMKHVEINAYTRLYYNYISFCVVWYHGRHEDDGCYCAWNPDEKCIYTIAYAGLISDDCLPAIKFYGEILHVKPKHFIEVFTHLQMIIDNKL